MQTDNNTDQGINASRAESDAAKLAEINREIRTLQAEWSVEDTADWLGDVENNIDEAVRACVKLKTNGVPGDYAALKEKCRDAYSRLENVFNDALGAVE